MLIQLPNECILKIIEYLYNHEIMDLFHHIKEIKNIISMTYLEEFMSYRTHPLVFNKFDNYCVLCNQGLIFYNEEDNIYNIQCNHK